MPEKTVAHHARKMPSGRECYAKFKKRAIGKIPLRYHRAFGNVMCLCRLLVGWDAEGVSTLQRDVHIFVPAYSTPMRAKCLIRIQFKGKHLDDIAKRVRPSDIIIKITYRASTASILSPIHLSTGTAMLLPIILYRGPSFISPPFLLTGTKV